MTSCEKNDSLLRAFGLPAGGEGAADEVRGVLSRLLASRALRLADLQTARDIAERAGVTAPESYLFLAAMFVSSGKGNAFMRDSDVEALLVAGGYLDDPMKLGFTESNDEYGTRLNALCRTLSDAAWKTALENDVLERDDERWYFQRDRNAVGDLNAVLKAFASAEKLGSIKEDLLNQAALFSFELNDAQKAALKAAATQRFTVITGGPGTGKTTTVCAILRALLAVNPDWTEKDIALAAPTGRAAQRMQEAILDQCKGLGEDEKIRTLARKLEGSTVHRLLGGYAPNWKHDEKHPLEKKVVIVDETSMVDLYLMQALLKALPKDARLILLGDADQLPSVDTGAVLGDLTSLGMGTDVVRRLETCERAKGEIYDVSKAINKSDGTSESVCNLTRGWQKLEVDDLPCKPGSIPDGKSEFRWLPPGAGVRKADILDFYAKWMSGNRLAELANGIPKDNACLFGQRTSKSEALFKELNCRRILTLVREGWYGVKEANAYLLKEAKSAARKPYADYLSLVGVPVMVTKNTPERRLFNGDVGVTVRTADGMVVLFPRGERTVVCPVALLPEHELAYAMTVHKSQGSEFENVMVVLPDDAKHPLLTREIVYTGITRAKKRAVVMGTEEALRTALSNRIVRNTGVSV